MILNAKITHAEIMIEDHGCLTFCIQIDSSEGWSTGIGMFDLNGCQNIDILIRDILKTVGITRWSDLTGKYIRIDDNNNRNSTITKIGNILTDNWIDLRSYFL